MNNKGKTKTIYAYATKIDNKHIYFECPVCKNTYNKNGTPRKNSQEKTHIHGSNGELHNRVEHRIHHHNHSYGSKWGDVYIRITDDTERC